VPSPTDEQTFSFCFEGEPFRELAVSQARLCLSDGLARFAGANQFAAVLFRVPRPHRD